MDYVESSCKTLESKIEGVPFVDRPRLTTKRNETFLLFSSHNLSPSCSKSYCKATGMEQICLRSCSSSRLLLAAVPLEDL